MNTNDQTRDHAPGKKPSTVRYRLGIASRALAALPLGYALSALTDALLALALPRLLKVPQEDAIIAAALFSNLVWPVVVLWVFTARTAWRAWMGLLVPGLILAVAVWILRGMLGAAT